LAGGADFLGAGFCGAGFFATDFFAADFLAAGAAFGGAAFAGEDFQAADFLDADERPTADFLDGDAFLATKRSFHALPGAASRFAAATGTHTEQQDAMAQIVLFQPPSGYSRAMEMAQKRANIAPHAHESKVTKTNPRFPLTCSQTGARFQ
jgi:hypothetical protein